MNIQKKIAQFLDRIFTLLICIAGSAYLPLLSQLGKAQSPDKQIRIIILENSPKTRIA
jgi:hypothetical protein